jgi:hypothetical protein
MHKIKDFASKHIHRTEHESTDMTPTVPETMKAAQLLAVSYIRVSSTTMCLTFFAV